MSNQRIIHFTFVPLTALALLAALVFLTAGPSTPVQAADTPDWQQMSGTMPMTGTMPAMMNQMMQQMQTMMGQGMGMMGAMSNTLPMTGTMPMKNVGMGSMMQTMGMMMQMMGRMQEMREAGTAMTDTMPMTGGVSTGTMAQMMQIMRQIQNKMAGTTPMTRTLPTGKADIGQMMQTMGMMMQMMGQMENMRGMETSAMTNTMPMTGTMPLGKAGMNQMMSTMAQMMAQMQNMAGAADGSTSITPTVPATTTSATSPQRDQTQLAEAGAVTIKVTPLNLQDAQAASLDFDVVLDTHSANLDFDLAKNATLQAGDAQVVASAWKTPDRKGHHVEGTLSFPTTNAAGQSLLTSAKTVSLVLKGLPGNLERTFTWNLTIAATPEHATLQGSVWVADEEGNSVTVIDAATNQVVTTLTGIEGPHNLQVASDGKSVWAVSGHEAVAVMIDPATYTLHGSVPTGKHPAHIILTPNGKTAYVTNGDDNSVSAIDTVTMKVIATIPVGKYPHGLRPSPDGKWVYVANAKDITLSVLDTTTNTKVADIEVGQNPVQVGFSPDGKFVYFSLNSENAVGKINVATRKLVDKVKVGAGPIQVFVTPDNQYVLVANQGTVDKPSTTVSLIDTTTFAVVSTVETGKGAHGVAIDPSGKYAYITNIYGNNVAVLDIAARKVVTTVPTAEAPNGISFSPLAPAPAPSTTIEIKVIKPQAMIHDMGQQVMPFDLSKTTHIFKMTESGGSQQVIAKDPTDSAQIKLIQQHLQHEAMRFSAGDFSDPTSIHGGDMPGVKELAVGAAQIKTEYMALPNGAQITFTTQDLHLITAIHRWFGAQLSDHGADATY